MNAEHTDQQPQEQHELTREEKNFQLMLARNKERERRFAEEKIGKLIFAFSLPAIVGMMVNALYNVVDSIYIGNAIGTQGTGALNFVFPINIINFAFILLFGAGGAALYSIRMGQRKTEEAARVMGNAFFGAVAIAIVMMTVSLIFLEDLLRVFGTTSSSMRYALDYMQIVVLGLPFLGICVWGNNFMRATGRPFLSMIAIMIGGVINIVLDPIFIFVLEMGMKGAALATIIGQIASSIWMVVHFILPRARIRLRLKNVVPHGKTLFSITKYGFPFLVFQSAASLVQFTINHVIVSYAGQAADDTVAAMGALQKFQTLIYMPITGLSQGITPIMAFNYGAKRIDRSNKVLLYSTIAATIVGLIGFAIAQSVPRGIMYVVVPKANSQYYEIGEHIVRFWSLGYPLLGYMLASNYFTATGKPTFSAFLAIFRQVIIFVPLVTLFPLWWGFRSMFYANAVADVVTFVVVAISLAVVMRAIRKRAAQPEQKSEEG